MEVHRKNPVFIGESQESVISLDSYYVPEHYAPYLDHILIPHGNIMDRVEKLAFDICHV